MLMATPVADLVYDGLIIERKHFKDIKELVKITKRYVTINEIRVPVASLPYTMSSDAGHMMAEGEPFAMCYWDTATHRIFSLRSTKDVGMDVSVVASSYGGGGHKHASGFSVTREHPLASI